MATGYGDGDGGGDGEAEKLLSTSKAEGAAAARLKPESKTMQRVSETAALKRCDKKGVEGAMDGETVLRTDWRTMGCCRPLEVGLG